VSLFADDTVVYMNGNSSQFQHVFNIFETFGRTSGCEINIKKSSAFYIGCSKKIRHKPYSSDGLSWPEKSVKYLGITIRLDDANELSIMNANFSIVISDIQTILNLWSCRGLTLLGKITIFKSLVIPKIIHKAFYLPLHFPETFIKKLIK